MKYFSMFSGIGGFELGIERATEGKWECVGFSEIDKYAVQIYTRHFPEHRNFGDATRIVPEELPDFDFLCGGFPCQAFSIAGKRGGFKDTRGTLFFEIERILAVKRPELLLLENVAGLLSHDNGNTFGTILSTLSELGYFCEWQVLNSKDFGVPQNRERVFIVGHLGNECRGQVFPIRANDQADIELSTLTARYYGGQANGGYLREITPQGQSQGMRVYDSDGISTTIASQAGGLGAKTGLYAIPVLTPDRSEKRQNGRRMKTDGEPAFTLTAQDKHGVFDGYRIRRLTPTECERLQGFPDDWCDGVSDSQKYKCLGNAVTVNVIQAIMERITEQRRGKDESHSR